MATFVHAPSRPLLTTTQVLLVWNCFTFSLISFLSSSQLLPFLPFICPIDKCLFPSWCCLFFSSFSFHFFFYPRHVSCFSRIGRPLNLAFIGWHIAFDYSLSSLNLVLFWSFKQPLTGCLWTCLAFSWYFHAPDVHVHYCAGWRRYWVAQLSTTKV